MRVYMSALKAPGNVEALLRPTQDALFRERGWASARALPPILPIAYAREEDDLPPAAGGAHELVIGGLRIDSAQISATVDGGVPAVPEPPEGGAATSLPKPGALFLAVNEEQLSAVELSELPEPAQTRVRQWWHLVLELEFEDQARWWYSLRWRECDSTRLKKRS
jgi:hypothetical protein